MAQVSQNLDFADRGRRVPSMFIGGWRKKKAVEKVTVGDVLSIIFAFSILYLVDKYK